MKLATAYPLANAPEQTLAQIRAIGAFHAAAALAAHRCISDLGAPVSDAAIKAIVDKAVERLRYLINLELSPAERTGAE